MKRCFLFLLLSAALIFIWSCEEKRSDTKFYYPIDSLLNAQTQYLAKQQAKLSKEAVLNDKTESGVYIPSNDTIWMHELDVFATLNDINKPILVGKYKTEKAVKDVASNLLIYTMQSTEKLPVVYLKVYYLNTLSEIRKIEGLYHEESSLLKSTRELSMEFQKINNKIVLTSYSLRGGQKMLLGDSVAFSIHGTITLP